MRVHECPRYLHTVVTPVHTICSSNCLPFGIYYHIIGAELTRDVETAEQRERDQEAEDAAIWVPLGVGSEEVDSEVTESSEVTLPLRGSQRLRGL